MLMVKSHWMKSPCAEQTFLSRGVVKCRALGWREGGDGSSNLRPVKCEAGSSPENEVNAKEGLGAQGGEEMKEEGKRI